MTRQFDIAGQSGAQYRYKALEELKPVSPGGANYLFVSWSGDTAKIIHAGETDSLHRAVFDTWDEARVEHGEQLGDSSLLYLSLAAGGLLTARIEGHADAAAGQVLAVSLRPGALHLFDSDGRACRRTVALPR